MASRERVRHGLLGAILALALPGVASSSEILTSFEFTDTSGQFTLGDPAFEATFTGGEAKTAFNPPLYHTGAQSWMIVAGGTGSITFSPPSATVTSIELWFRDQLAGPGSVLTVFDTSDQVIHTATATTAFAHVVVTVNVSEGVPGIGRITLSNTGGAGYAVIDDFQACLGTMGGGLVDPIPAPILAGTTPVRLVELASGLTAPNGGTFAPGDAGRIFVTDQEGILWSIDLSSGAKTVFLDVTSRLVALGVFGPDSFDERGLLGVAFHPAYRTNGLLYTYTSEDAASHPGPADFSTLPPGVAANHQSVVTEWTVPSPEDPDSVADPTSARILLRVDEPQFNHDGGCLAFGPDGLLYISLGDGGGADDQDGEDFFGAPIVGHGLGGNGQDPTNVLGTVLRIDPLGSSAPNGAYGIPPGNPFVGSGAGFVEEIFAYGFRNPFRFSFDRLTGALVLGDVGQNDIEEIDLVTAGGNYGWNLKEGSFFFNPNGNGPGFVTDVDPGVPAGLIDPIAEYDHDEGIAIIGGFVYRGSGIPGLAGRYVFGDWSRLFLANNGRLFELDAAHQIREIPLVGGMGLGLSLQGFAEDSSGELYLLGNSTGTPFGSTGVVLKLTAGDCTASGGDADGDGICDNIDMCPSHPQSNLLQTDSDGDGIPDECQCGDASGDGILDATDVLMTQNCFLGLSGTCDPDLSDTDGDHTVSAADVLQIQNAFLGLTQSCSLVCTRSGIPDSRPACTVP